MPCTTCVDQAEEVRVVGRDHRNVSGERECPECGRPWDDLEVAKIHRGSVGATLDVTNIGRSLPGAAVPIELSVRDEPDAGATLVLRINPDVAWEIRLSADAAALTAGQLTTVSEASV